MDGPDQTVWTAVLTGAGGLAGAAAGWWGRHRQERRADRAETRAAILAERQADQNTQAGAIAERDALIKTITETLVDPLRREVAELRGRLEQAESKIDTLEDRNDRLVAFIYKLVGIIRRAGQDHEILPGDVPPGIHL